jgi:hypothetical protein
LNRNGKKGSILASWFVVNAVPISLKKNEYDCLVLYKALDGKIHIIQGE